MYYLWILSGIFISSTSPSEDETKSWNFWKTTFELVSKSDALGHLRPEISLHLWEADLETVFLTWYQSTNSVGTVL